MIFNVVPFWSSHLRLIRRTSKSGNKEITSKIFYWAWIKSSQTPWMPISIVSFSQMFRLTRWQLSGDTIFVITKRPFKYLHKQSDLFILLCKKNTFQNHENKICSTWHEFVPSKPLLIARFQSVYMCSCTWYSWIFNMARNKNKNFLKSNEKLEWEWWSHDLHWCVGKGKFGKMEGKVCLFLLDKIWQFVKCMKMKYGKEKWFSTEKKNSHEQKIYINIIFLQRNWISFVLPWQIYVTKVWILKGYYSINHSSEYPYIFVSIITFLSVEYP